MSITFEDYLKKVQLEQLFKQLGASNPRILARTVKHFATKEGEKRDQIVADYFGPREVERIVVSIAGHLFADPRIPENATVLDVGAGSGSFTIAVEKMVKTKLPKVEFYAMDPTPTMLLSLTKKTTQIIPFIGLAENIEGSIQHARKFFKIPSKFDSIFSTLMLHHSTQPEKVFESISQVLKKNGKAVIVDLCEHSFTEFKEEMGDIYLGFKPENIKRMAQKHFSTVEVKKIPGIRCKSSGRSAEIFVATMQNPL
jgi:ubiquinone/menaquinone biosynthesis C-methylase UbiE